MIGAYTTVITSAGTAEDVAERIRELPNVTEAHVVAGEFDVIAEIEADDVYDVQKTVSSGIGSLEGVGRARTYVRLD
ncbi:Lrp/AsnC ligand binding domain-containing protein [Haladaptatus salinisoli]|uniref:Lrp/AsnC ligand binding domain-containing protein n=1 Tax=Haladaptatus salinisoli TaxID=2884876 RepID=UPI001D0AB99B|nr:Lrp/AsnC ligand binding domain-containing protein [Haladaptatus salinisoli]